MADTATQTEISKYIVGLYGASAGGFFPILEEFVDAGNTPQAMAEILVNDASFTGLDPNYAADAADADFVSTFVNNLVGTSLDAATITAVNELLLGLLEGGWSRGQLVVATIDALDSIPADDATYGDAAALFDAKVAAAFEDAVTNGNTETDITALQAVIADVTLPPGEFNLAVGLDNLAGANDAVDAFLAALGDLDTDLDGTDDVDAGDAVAADVDTYYASAAADMGLETTVTGFASRSDAVQDAAIADALADYETALATETADAAVGMTALLAAAQSQADVVETAQQAKLDSLTDYTAELAAFNSANGLSTIVYDEDYDATADYTGQLIISNGVAYTGQDGTGTPVALSALDADNTVLRVAALETAYDADVAAAAALTSAKTSLEAAVDAVVLAETEAFSVYDLGSVVVYNDAAATVTLDYSATDIEVFDTEALADADAAGAKEVFTAAFSTEATPAAETILFDGATINVAAGATATAIGTAVAAASFTNWIAVDNADGSVTFTAKNVGDVANVVAADFAGTYDEVVTISGLTNGIAADVGTGATPGQSVPDAFALEGAIADLADFEELSAAFAEARQLDDTLTALEDAVADAEAAIENDVDDAVAPGLGLNLEVFTNGAVATAFNDVYLYDADEATVGITSFGVTGEDTLYFGAEYTLVEMADGDVITDALGDASTLEIFAQVVGGNTTLYVEEETFAGSGSTAADTVQITLTGVADYAFADGFLSSGTAV